MTLHQFPRFDVKLCIPWSLFRRYISLVVGNFSSIAQKLSMCFLLRSLTGGVRSNHRRCFVKIGVLRNIAKFTVKHLCQSLFFNKVADPRPATSLKKGLWHRWFAVNFAIFLRAPIFTSCGCFWGVLRTLLNIHDRTFFPKMVEGHIYL